MVFGRRNKTDSPRLTRSEGKRSLGTNRLRNAMLDGALQITVGIV